MYHFICQVITLWLTLLHKNEPTKNSNPMMRTAITLLWLAAYAAVCSASSLRLPAIIGDNAVIQQDTDITLWGWANPGSKVTATPSWQAGAATATTGADGKWTLEVHTPKASYTPLEITFSDSDGESKTIRNLLSGEVWLASGQSNMEMPLRGFWTQPV